MYKALKTQDWRKPRKPKHEKKKQHFIAVGDSRVLIGQNAYEQRPVGQVKHGLTLPKRKELWKKEIIVWYCT